MAPPGVYQGPLGSKAAQGFFGAPFGSSGSPGLALPSASIVSGSLVLT
jgi:hypothetical protein